MTASSEKSSEWVNQPDFEAKRKEYLFEAPQWLTKKLLKNEEDSTIVHLLYNLTLITLPSLVLQFYFNSHLFGIFALLTNYVLFIQRFMLMLHFSQHKCIFKPEFAWLDQYIAYILCPLFGVPSGTYHLHHVIMHHIEGNLPLDLSSTMHYKRDSVVHYLHYWMRFSLLIWIELPLYAIKKNRTKTLVRLVACLCLYWISVYALYNKFAAATTWTFLLPFVVSSFLLTFGNWCQHIFVDPARPGSPYGITYNLINTEMNQLTFNDGYHLMHHLNPLVHWTKLPEYFRTHYDNLIQHQGLTFDKLDYIWVGIFAMTNNYRKLADYYVPLDKNEKVDRDAIAKRLKSMVEPVTNYELKPSKKAL